MLAGLKNVLIKLRHGFQGYPVVVGGSPFRIDESLRRWNFDVDPEVREALIAQLQVGDTAIDIGANFGMHSLIMAQSVAPRGRVIAFEPDPKNLRLLRRNIALNHFGNIVTIHPMAISDLNENHLEMVVETARLEPGAGIETSLRTVGTTAVVKNSSLDLACRELHPERGCLIKIDVEGAELSVLNSGVEFIERIKPKLLIEVHTYALPSFGASAEHVHAFLEQHGYRVRRLTEMTNANGEYYHILALPQS